MNASRFQEAKRIYGSALERTPAEREAYVAEACAGDESLQHEVEALLDCSSEAQEFFRTPVIDALLQAPPIESRSDLAGRTLSHYELIENVGEGGMGVVYKARDTHLDRVVALKLLPPDKLIDPERRWRFEQEARAASSLNHPNIVTIHDIDTADNVTFIAMEYVAGNTLDALIRDKSMSTSDAVKYGVQIADALATAHRAGIVHRDIKPANIIVTDTGTVKVLDFGLAKLTEPASRMEASTEPGLILGTLAYMSPEQAEGKDVDARSDIFSFGSLLYEMTTGRRAFCDEAGGSTLAAILRDEPKPVCEVEPEAPRRLAEIIACCLRKNPEHRFQDMADLKLALEELRGQPGTPTPRLHRRRTWIAGGVLLAAACGLAIWFGGLRRSPTGPATKVSMLAALPGCQWSPAFSPDGKQVAFVWSRESQDQHNIYVQLAGDVAPRQLTNAAAFEYSPVWSPDALYIAFLRETPAGTEVIIVPSAGGTERRVHVSKASCRMSPRTLTRVACGLAWSPDGKFLALVDKELPEAPNSVFLLDIKTLEARTLTMPPPGFEDGLSAFSPDGRSLAFERRPGLPLSDIYVQPLSSNGRARGAPRQVTHDNVFVLGMDWTADSREIVFSSSRGGAFALWQVPATGGEPERLSVGGSDASWPAISRKGDRLAFATGANDQNIWRIAAPGGGMRGPLAAPLRITQSPLYDQDAVFSPDGRSIAFTSMYSGSHQVWVSGSDGSHPIKLTDMDAPGADAPQWSPDGRLIAFRGHSPKPSRVYVVGSEGGAPHRVTAGDFEEDPPAWSHDGKWIYFGSDRGNGYAVWKAAVGGGVPIVVAPKGWWPRESADGRFVYYSEPAGIWKSPVTGGSPVLVAPHGDWPLYEAVDGTSIYYSGPGGNIWRASVAGTDAVPVLKRGEQGRALWALSRTGFHVLDPDAKVGPAIIFCPLLKGPRETIRLAGRPDAYAEAFGPLSISPDGKWLLYPRQDRNESVIMLVENFRNR